MTRPIVAFLQPMGERLFDNVGGQDVLIRRIQELGCDVVVTPWNKANRAVTLVTGIYTPDRPVFVLGVSCGANVAAWVCKELGKTRVPVAYAAWIQPSRWCVSGWMPPISPNVKEAFIIYGSCLTTLGFGCYKPPLEQMPALVPPDKSLYDGKKRIGNGGRTTVSWFYKNDLHPADFDKRGVQDPILRDMARLMNSPADITKLMMKHK